MAPSVQGDTVNVQLTSATANTTYYIGVEAATSGLFAAGRYGLAELSMGMSNDLEVGIEEGATMVRVGTALFGPRPKA